MAIRNPHTNSGRIGGRAVVDAVTPARAPARRRLIATPATSGASSTMRVSLTTVAAATAADPPCDAVAMT